MSEHWKSTPKYWCKHCSTYVKDTPFERKQHENTGKHQGNLRRFLQGIQKDHAQNERDKDKAKAEVERLNRIAGSASASASGSRSGLGTSSAALSSQAAPTKPPRASSNNLSAIDQKRQWAQLADMGIAIPEHARAEMAMAGDWQTMPTKPDHKHGEHTDDKLNVGIRKRKFEDSEEGGASIARKGWGSTTRTYPGSISVEKDLDALLSLPLLKKEKSVQTPPGDDQKPTLLSSVPDAQPLTIKAETSDIADEKLLVVQEAESQSMHTTSIRASEIQNETLDTDTKMECQEVSVPVFKKRKAKPLPATKASGKF